MTKAERAALREKFGGRCAYCGETLGERWHADHMQPVIREQVWRSGEGFSPTGTVLYPERDTIENRMPACAPCNIDKGGMSLEYWREKLQRAAEVLRRNSSTYRHALRFGLVSETDAKVRFHFEAQGLLSPSIEKEDR